MRDYLDGMGIGMLIGFLSGAATFWGLAALFGAV